MRSSAPSKNRWNSAIERFTLEWVKVRLYASPSDFGSVARWVYRRDPVRFTAELTTLRASRWPPGQVLLSTFDGDALGAAVQMRESVLLVSGLPPASAKEAAVALAEVQADLPATRGTAATAIAFSEAWVEATGADVRTSFEEVLYRLDEFDPPTAVVGEPRLAGGEDAELLAGWLNAFFVEAFSQPSNPSASRDVLAAIVEAGGHIVLWTVNGSPVAMARVHRCLLGVSRIGPVYTPPEERGHGFGAAVTAEAVRHARRNNARDVVLFADVANPVSNRIYRRLGFVPVAEHVQYAFSS